MASLTTAFPAPGPALKAEFVPWQKGVEIQRIHKMKYGSMDFNASGLGDARFSPISDAAGGTIPTLYGGITFECAAMETVFHDLSHAAGYKSYDKNKLKNERSSIIAPTRDLNLVNLGSKPLHKLGISRSLLLESDAADYSKTRPWAQALHVQFPDADGLRWVSRQDDEGYAIVLFGDRVKKNDLKEVSPPTDIINDSKLYLQLLTLAQLVGVDFL